MALKRVFAGFYTRYDGKPIFVVRVLKDIDTGESIVVCKDASFAKEDNVCVPGADLREADRSDEHHRNRSRQ